MGFYARLSQIARQQECVLCGKYDVFCVCEPCQAKLQNHPHRCQSCAAPLFDHLNFCGSCLANAPAFHRAYALFNYDDFSKELIKQFKYHRRLCVGRYFAEQLANALQTLLDDGAQFDAIMPMPLHKNRLRTRGYNQVVELLRVIKQRHNILIDTRSCVRQKSTQSLTKLNPEQRRREISHAFRARPNLPYKNVLLVDDVLTTGASLNALTRVIVRANPQIRCEVLVLARP